MPEEIRKPSILRGLASRLGIEPGVIAVRRWLAPAVMPVTQVDALLEESLLDFKLANLSGSGDPVVYFTVPAKKRWRLLLVKRYVTAGNSRLSIKDVARNKSFFLEDTGTAAVLHKFGRDYVLGPGWVIRMDHTENAGDMNVYMDIWYIEEDAF
ncbi:hypothetical protein ES705_35427 [subsurface metagenome]